MRGSSPLSGGFVSPSLKPVTISFYTLPGQYIGTGGGVRWLPSSVSMPKRAKAVPAMAVLAGADPFESMESRRRRLAPPSAPPAAQHAKACVVTHTASSSPAASRPVHTVVRPPSRMDAPVMHPTRRGSKAKAAAAIRSTDARVAATPQAQFAIEVFPGIERHRLTRGQPLLTGAG